MVLPLEEVPRAIFAGLWRDIDIHTLETTSGVSTNLPAPVSGRKGTACPPCNLLEVFFEVFVPALVKPQPPRGVVNALSHGELSLSTPEEHV
jgi:hypothetical protein